MGGQRGSSWSKRRRTAGGRGRRRRHSNALDGEGYRPDLAGLVGADGGPEGRAVFRIGRPSSSLGVRSTISDADLVRLTSSVLDALNGPPDQPNLEITPIAAAQLSAWSRPPGPARIPAPAQRPWDSRWLWLTALILLAVESLVRGSLKDEGPTRQPMSLPSARVA